MPLTKVMKWTSLLSLLSFSFLLVSTHEAAALSEPTLVASFDADALETPEALWIDQHNDVFVTLGLTGELRQIASDGSQSTFAMLPLGAPPMTFCFGFVPALTGVDRDAKGDWYLGLRSCQPGRTGIYELDPDGTNQRLIGPMPDGLLPNGLAVVGDTVYVAESFGGGVWTVPTSGGAATLWNADPLLQPAPGSGLPGANGLKFFDGAIVVASSQKGLVVEIPINCDGSSGTAFELANTNPFGCDDFSFDRNGALYCGTDLYDTLLQVGPDGTWSVLYTAADGLDGPSATLFGNGPQGQTLYVANAALPFFSSTHTPSIFKVDLGVRTAQDRPQRNCRP